ncbi:hypothetical protein Tco_0778846, partial [Tanacetum coccineum]
MMERWSQQGSGDDDGVDGVEEMCKWWCGCGGWWGMAWDSSGGGVGCSGGSGGWPEAAPDSWPEKERGKMGA